MTPRFAPISSALLAVALTACASLEPTPPHVAGALTPTEQFAIEVAPVADEILLAPHGYLSPAQTAALGELAMRWREAGEGAIVVQAPSAGPAGNSGRAAVAALQQFGVPAGSVQLSSPDPNDASVSSSPVKVGFGRLAAVVPDCANQWGELTRTRENLPHAAFGCATAANFAAQVADPRDLTRPRALTAADAERRGVVLGKYRLGERTGAETGEEDRGVVSRTIQ